MKLVRITLSAVCVTLWVSIEALTAAGSCESLSALTAAQHDNHDGAVGCFGRILAAGSRWRRTGIQRAARILPRGRNDQADVRFRHQS